MISNDKSLIPELSQKMHGLNRNTPRYNDKKYLTNIHSMHTLHELAADRLLELNCNVHNVKNVFSAIIVTQR